jgi:hypothetical protein
MFSTLYERCLVPVCSDVIEVELDDRPESVSDKRRVVVVEKPVRISNEVR